MAGTKSLTQKQEEFCLAYIETGNATEAYRRSYDASRMNSASVNRKAKELLDNVKIAARIAELRAPVVERAQITLEQHLADLKALRDKAEQEGKFGPAIQAEIARGKASGLYVDKVDLGLPAGGSLLRVEFVEATKPEKGAAQNERD
ncbi:terminase small subunit [Burkholderia multivorans]|uniref:terminase small subunit n=1 Tax=Burkholderia multivorans TaxID=87883 RepID=UPI0021D9E43E|nr:terminase small subunit [Burkholderia multivorans]UXZ59905.1 terminase small subunit [Burkholderia multivorans]